MRFWLQQISEYLLASPVFYLIVCVLAVWLLGRAYWSAERSSAQEGQAGTTSEGENIPDDDAEQSDWQQVWREMNPTVSASAERTSLVTAGIEVLPRMQLCIENLGLSMEELCDFQSLFNRFYTLNSGTSITGDELDARTLLSKDLSIGEDNSQPQILIYHTHSQEAFRDSEAGAVQDTVVGVGEELNRILTEQYGYNVLHDVGTYDMTDGVLDRDSAYQNAYPAIEEILSQYPSIQVVIDLHRDGVLENVHLVTEIDGVQTAKIMFFNGVCRDENGALEDLVNPYLEDNLAFSLQMRLASMMISEDFCRTNYLKTWRYNQQLLGRCLLVEVGAQTNTVQEALNACAPLAQALDYVLGGT